MVRRVSDTELAETAVPFLPAIPRKILSLGEQMEMLWGRGVVDYVGVKPWLIRDAVETPSSPYYIFDMETNLEGEMKPRGAGTLLRKRGRRGLTGSEAIALAMHTDVLSHGCVVALESGYGSDHVLDLFVDFGRPRFCWVHLDADHGGKGLASCTPGSSRLAPR